MVIEATRKTLKKFICALSYAVYSSATDLRDSLKITVDLFRFNQRYN